VAILVTTGGHTMNLREMGVSQGWVAEEVYALQSCYLFSLALTMLACPALARRWSARSLTQWGLVLAVVGPVLNVMEAWESLQAFLAARAIAGAGAGLVIYFTPCLLGARWTPLVAWAFILCPVAGPGVVSAATMLDESSDWRHGFLFEGLIAAAGLVALLSMARIHERPSRPMRGTLAYLPPLVVASAALAYILHWGQLHGWLESPDILTATTILAVASLVSLYLVWPQIDRRLLRENWVRLVSYFFGGMCQFFHAYLMNVYGGTLVNLSSWQRAWLIWPLPIGMAASLATSALALPYLRRRRGRIVLGLPAAVAGLLVAAGGFSLCYWQMMEWPYWDVRDAVDLNWFPAPGGWELAPGRLLMGVGIGLLMVATDTQLSPDPQREGTVRSLLGFLQFLGGGLAAGVLVNFLSIGHKVHYSYSAERDAIQAEELVQRIGALTNLLHQAGKSAPVASARVLMYRFINYESDNLVFATIYVAFALAALSVAGLFFSLWVWHRLRRR
jgi:MFS family permease